MRPVEVLHDEDFWARLLAHVTPVFRPGAGMLLGMGGVARLDHHRHCVADHRPHLGHEVVERLAADPLARRVMGRDLLPAVVDRGRIEAAEFQQGGLIELRSAGGGNGHRCLLRGERFTNMICHISKTCQPRDAAGVRGLSVPSVSHSRLSRASLTPVPKIWVSGPAHPQARDHLLDELAFEVVVQQPPLRLVVAVADQGV